MLKSLRQLTPSQTVSFYTLYLSLSFCLYLLFISIFFIYIFLFSLDFLSISFTVWILAFLSIFLLSSISFNIFFFSIFIYFSPFSSISFFLYISISAWLLYPFYIWRSVYFPPSFSIYFFLSFHLFILFFLLYLLLSIFLFHLGEIEVAELDLWNWFPLCTVYIYNGKYMAAGFEFPVRMPPMKGEWVRRGGYTIYIPPSPTHPGSNPRVTCRVLCIYAMCVGNVRI